jgi:CrcB protein
MTSQVMPPELAAAAALPWIGAIAPAATADRPQGGWMAESVTAPARPRGRARARHVTGRLGRVWRDRWDILAVIAVGGALGSLGRWALTLLLPHPAGTFPWATFTANVTGCLLLGVLMVFVLEVWPSSRYVRPLLGVGVLGGYTTFSSYMLDARALLVAGRTTLAGEYVFGSLVAGLLAVWIGATAARLAVRLRLRRAAHRRAASSDVDSSDVDSSDVEKTPAPPVPPTTRSSG